MSHEINFSFFPFKSASVFKFCYFVVSGKILLPVFYIHFQVPLFVVTHKTLWPTQRFFLLLFKENDNKFQPCYSLGATSLASGKFKSVIIFPIFFYSSLPTKHSRQCCCITISKSVFHYHS